MANKVRCRRCSRMVPITEVSQKKGLCTRCLGELMLEAGSKGGKMRAINARRRKEAGQQENVN